MKISPAHKTCNFQRIKISEQNLVKVHQRNIHVKNHSAVCWRRCLNEKFTKAQTDIQLVGCLYWDLTPL